MTKRRWGNILAVVIFASTLTLTNQTPVAAHGTSGVTADDSSADRSLTASDGTTNIKVRVLQPTDTPPPGGWPLMIYKAGSTTSRCNDLEWYSRSALAAHGFVVVSVNGRGFPGAFNADKCGTSTASVNAEITDSLNDSGFDAQGPNDIQDIKDVIDWALDSNRGNLPVNSTKIGFIGASYYGGLAYLLARNDSRVKAIVTDSAPTTSPIGSVAGLSDHPRSEVIQPTLGYLFGSMGWFGHADSAVLTNLAEAYKDTYIGSTIPASTQSFFNSRTVLDDNLSVDQAHLVTTPAFVVAGFMDGSVNPSLQIEAWKKLPIGDKYLYVGACGHNSNPAENQCLDGTPPSNQSNLRGYIHSFLDKYVRGDTVSMGGPIFYAVPPLSWQTATNWTVQQTGNLALSFVGSSTSTPAGSPTSITLTVPSGTTSRDAMIAAVAYPATAALTPPGGWTSVLTQSQGTTAMTIYYRVASSEPANYQWQISPGSNIMGTMLSYRNASLSMLRPIEAAGAQGNASSTNIVAPSISPKTSGITQLGLFLGIGSTDSITQPTNWTERVDTGAAGTVGALEVATSPVQSAAASTGTATATHANASASIGAQLALTPATWPPPEITGSPLRWYLRSGTCSSTKCLMQSPPSTSEPVDTITNNLWSTAIQDSCAASGYTSGESVTYTSDTSAAVPLKLVQLDADIYIRSESTTRLALVVDAFKVTGGGAETRIWRGSSFIVPNARGQNAQTTVRFRFIAGGAAITFATGDYFRIKVATNYRGHYAQEPFKGDYSVYHTTAEPSMVVAHFAS